MPVRPLHHGGDTEAVTRIVQFSGSHLWKIKITCSHQSIQLCAIATRGLGKGKRVSIQVCHSTRDSAMGLGSRRGKRKWLDGLFLRSSINRCRDPSSADRLSHSSSSRRPSPYSFSSRFLAECSGRASTKC